MAGVRRGERVPRAQRRLPAGVLARRRDHRRALPGRRARRRRVRIPRGRGEAPLPGGRAPRRGTLHRSGADRRRLAGRRTVHGLLRARLRLPAGREHPVRALAHQLRRSLHAAALPVRLHRLERHALRPGRHGLQGVLAPRHDRPHRRPGVRAPRVRGARPGRAGVARDGGRHLVDADPARGRHRAQRVVLLHRRTGRRARRRAGPRLGLGRAGAQAGLCDVGSAHPAVVRPAARGRCASHGRECSLRRQPPLPGARRRRPRATAGLSGLRRARALGRTPRAPVQGRVLPPGQLAPRHRAHRGRAHPPAGEPG